MSTVARSHDFPLFAVVLGAIGSLCLLLGLLGQFSPGLVSFAAVLAEATVSAALVTMGAILLTLELAIILSWSKRRATAGQRK
jgi:hypothetical protein